MEQVFVLFQQYKNSNKVLNEDEDNVISRT